MASLRDDYAEFIQGLIILGMVMLVFGLSAATRFGGNTVDDDSCFAAADGSGCYCENMLIGDAGGEPFRIAPKTRRAAIKQPVNTWTNLGFVAMGLGILWWIGWERREGQSSFRNRMTREPFFPAIYGLMTILMGPGSMFFHASLKQWGGWIDGVSMYLFMGYILVHNVVRYFNWSRTRWIVLYLVVTTVMAVLGWVMHEQATLVFAGLGGVTLLSQILVADAEDLSTDTSGVWWFFSGMLAFGAAFVVWRLAWTGAALCTPTSLWQGHGLWHLLSAFVVFSVWKYFRAEKAVAATGPEPMPGFLRVLAGIVFGGGFAFGFHYYLFVEWLGTSERAALIVAIVAGTIGAVYGAIALGYRSYAFGIFALRGPTRWFLCFSRKLWSTLGFILDVTWGLLNTAIALIVWIPASLIAGASHQASTKDHRESGNMVFSRNPLGVPAITVGPAITGRFMSHEVVHTWQSRLFGPFWLPVYLVAYCVNVVCRVFRFRLDGLYFDCYHRIVFEDHAYWGGSTKTNDFSWGGLVLGFVVCLLYTMCALAVAAGVFLDGPVWAAWTGLIVVVVYSYVRAWLKHDLGGH